LAIGLAICFFFPWLNAGLERPTGLFLAKMDERFWFLWVIPFFCVLTLYAGITKKNQREVAQLCGAIPYLILVYWLSNVGFDKAKILADGAYVSLALGLLLLLFPRCASATNLTSSYSK